jgi:hypothetical protein
MAEDYWATSNLPSHFADNPRVALRAAIESLVAERDALKADAERYRYAKHGMGEFGVCVWDDDEGFWICDMRINIDAAIDAARGEKT